MVVKKKKPGTWFRFQPSNTCQSLSLKICSSLLRNTKIQNKSHKLNILRARIHNNTITQKTATEDGIMYTLPQGYIFYLWPKLSQPRKKEKTKTTHAGVNWAKKKKTLTRWGFRAMHDDFTTFSMVCSINSLLLLQVEIQVQSELLSDLLENYSARTKTGPHLVENE